MTASSKPRDAARLGLLESFRATGRTAWITATGESMRPSIPPGSGFLVEFGRLPERPGELIVFRRGEALVAHRFVARRQTRDGDRWMARGDGEGLLDPPLADDAVLGVARLVRLPDGRTEDLDRERRRAAVIAAVSWWSGRAAGAGTRWLRKVPGTRLRRAGMAVLVDLSRVLTRVVSEALPRSRRGQV